MNFQEHLLTCFNEELSETQQEVAKCLRFGIHDKCAIYPTTNWERVNNEWSDVQALRLMLADEDLHLEVNGTRMLEKKQRTLQAWHDYGSKSRDSLMKTEYQMQGIAGGNIWTTISKEEFETRQTLLSPGPYTLRTVYLP